MWQRRRLRRRRRRYNIIIAVLIVIAIAIFLLVTSVSAVVLSRTPTYLSKTSKEEGAFAYHETTAFEPLSRSGKDSLWRMENLTVFDNYETINEFKVYNYLGFEWMSKRFLYGTQRGFSSHNYKHLRIYKMKRRGQLKPSIIEKEGTLVFEFMVEQNDLVIKNNARYCMNRSDRYCFYLHEHAEKLFYRKDAHRDSFPVLDVSELTRAKLYFDQVIGPWRVLDKDIWIKAIPSFYSTIYAIERTVVLRRDLETHAIDAFFCVPLTHKVYYKKYFELSDTEKYRFFMDSKRNVPMLRCNFPHFDEFFDPTTEIHSYLGRNWWRQTSMHFLYRYTVTVKADITRILDEDVDDYMADAVFEEGDEDDPNSEEGKMRLEVRAKARKFRLENWKPNADYESRPPEMPFVMIAFKGAWAKMVMSYQNCSFSGWAQSNGTVVNCRPGEQDSDVCGHYVNAIYAEIVKTRQSDNFTDTDHHFISYVGGETPQGKVAHCSVSNRKMLEPSLFHMTPHAVVKEDEPTYMVDDLFTMFGFIFSYPAYAAASFEFRPSGMRVDELIEEKDSLLVGTDNNELKLFVINYRTFKKVACYPLHQRRCGINYRFRVKQREIGHKTVKISHVGFKIGMLHVDNFDKARTLTVFYYGIRDWQRKNFFFRRGRDITFHKTKNTFIHVYSMTEDDDEYLDLNLETGVVVERNGKGEPITETVLDRTIPEAATIISLKAGYSLEPNLYKRVLSERVYEYLPVFQYGYRNYKFLDVYMEAEDLNEAKSTIKTYKIMVRPHFSLKRARALLRYLHEYGIYPGRESYDSVFNESATKNEELKKGGKKSENIVQMPGNSEDEEPDEIAELLLSRRKDRHRSSAGVFKIERKTVFLILPVFSFMLTWLLF